MQKFFILCLLCFITACHGHRADLTSGESYLRKYQNQDVDYGQKEKLTFKEQLEKVASSEPILTLPTRIGIARIEGGRLTTIPNKELVAWENITKKLDSEYGEFIPITPLIAKISSMDVIHQNDGKMHDTISLIRLGAAKQHIDAVLIYEAYSKVNEVKNILSIGDLTIIGGFLLPSKEINIQSYSTGTLMNVMTGYTYATVNSITDKETTYGSSWGWGSDYKARHNFKAKMETKAAIKLADNTQRMIKDLKSKIDHINAKKE